MTAVTPFALDVSCVLRSTSSAIAWMSRSTVSSSVSPWCAGCEETTEMVSPCGSRTCSSRPSRPRSTPSYSFSTPARPVDSMSTVPMTCAAMPLGYTRRSSGVNVSPRMFLSFSACAASGSAWRTRSMCSASALPQAVDEQPGILAGGVGDRDRDARALRDLARVGADRDRLLGDGEAAAAAVDDLAARRVQHDGGAVLVERARRERGVVDGLELHGPRQRGDEEDPASAG